MGWYLSDVSRLSATVSVRDEPLCIHLSLSLGSRAKTACAQSDILTLRGRHEKRARRVVSIVISGKNNQMHLYTSHRPCKKHRANHQQLLITREELAP